MAEGARAWLAVTTEVGRYFNLPGAEHLTERQAAIKKLVRALHCTVLYLGIPTVLHCRKFGEWGTPTAGLYWACRACRQQAAGPRAQARDSGAHASASVGVVALARPRLILIRQAA